MCVTVGAYVCGGQSGSLPFQFLSYFACTWGPQANDEIILHPSPTIFIEAGALRPTQNAWICLVLLASLLWETPYLCLLRLELQADNHGYPAFVWGIQTSVLTFVQQAL